MDVSTSKGPFTKCHFCNKTVLLAGGIRIGFHADETYAEHLHMKHPQVVDIMLDAVKQTARAWEDRRHRMADDVFSHPLGKVPESEIDDGIWT